MKFQEMYVGFPIGAKGEFLFYFYFFNCFYKHMFNENDAA